MATVNASDIAWVGVYPPIGLARVGNAEGRDEFMVASEVVGGMPETRGGFQTPDGQIKRQAVRFHIYARLRSGSFIELVDEQSVKIEWRVEIANLKAGWYQFNQAMDLPAEFVPPARRRNAERGPRERLNICPAPRRINGAGLAGPEFRFDDGQFFQRPVYLGELRTDEQGRLLFLGGLGRSASSPAGMRPTTFANNDGWHDDIADGPVRAQVEIGGTLFEADPGYVVVTPPNYAPGISGLLTMDDAVRETFMAAGWLARPAETRFSRDVWPIFARLTGLQWVNHGLFVAHGLGSPLDARSTTVAAKLADNAAENRPWRQRVFELFRAPGETGEVSRLQLPYIYSDLFGEVNDEERTMLAVTPTMHAHLRRWAEGNFVSDWQGEPEPPRFADLAADEQVAQLTRAGLSECLGGPFHPGIELSWPMRRRELWALNRMESVEERFLYRLNLVPEGTAVRQDYGPELTRDVCLGAGGATEAAGPGALTRWLGVPWQTDEASCNSSADYSPSTYLSIPSFWAARAPEQVLSSEAWARAAAEIEDARPAELLQRLKHAFYREDWLRDVRGRDYFERIDNMVKLWATLGVVEPKTAPTWLVEAGFPAAVNVETGRDQANPGSDKKPQLIALIEGLIRDAEAETVAAMAGAAPPHAPPRHRFRQGEV